MNFKNNLTVPLSTLLLCGANVAFAKVNSPESSKRPNLLVIQVDEHNFRTIGSYRKLMTEDQAFLWGKGVCVETPNIDKIAERGIICSHFYTNCPQCSPSRASFLTGRFPQNTGVIVNGMPLDSSSVTFAEVLKKVGYSTGYAGKWHLTGEKEYPGWAPQRQFGFSDNKYMFNNGHWKQLEDGPDGPRIAVTDAKGNPSLSVNGATEKNYTTDFLAGKTIDFIKNHKDEPFCFMVSFPDPHNPNTVRSPYDTLYTHFKFNKPYTWNYPAGKEGQTISDAEMAIYFGMVKCIDDNVGKIIESLEQQKLLDNTIIVYTADHGDMLGEHHKDDKGVVYEASARIPFLIQYPAKINPKQVVSQVLSTCDFMPTILGLMNVPYAGTEQGKDASSIFIKNEVPTNWEDVIFSRGPAMRGNDLGTFIAAIDSHYKLIFSPMGSYQLFDLQKDPNELIDFATDSTYKTEIARLSKCLLNYGEKYNDKRVLNEPAKQKLILLSNSAK